MSLLGFPSAREVSTMMGYVTDEDREKWERMKATSDKQLEGSGLTAKDLASKSVIPAIGMAEKSINAQITGEQMAEREAKRNSRKETVRTETRTRFYENDVPTSSDNDQMSF